jgi:uncharacterized damage-inducible protein DinB
MPRPLANDYAPFYQTYVDKVSGDDLHVALNQYSRASLSFWQNIPEDKGDYAYAPGKWTVKQLLNHLCDAERIFTYRALRIARGDETPLAGFEEDDYAAAAQVSHRTLKDLVHEYQSVRSATLSLFNSFGEIELSRFGTTNGAKVSVNAIGFIIIGHTLHHEGVLKERYNL